MAHPYHHAQSSARKYGGSPEDYQEIHEWFDGSKAQMANFRHRALRHHAFGIFEMEEKFGTTLTNSDGKVVPTRFIGEQHVREDCGGIIPSAQDWLRGIPSKRWMNVGQLADDVPTEHDLENGASSLEAWREAVAAGETTLGHGQWVRRMEFLMSGPEAASPDDEDTHWDAAVDACVRIARDVVDQIEAKAADGHASPARLVVRDIAKLRRQHPDTYKNLNLKEIDIDALNFPKLKGEK